MDTSDASLSVARKNPPVGAPAGGVERIASIDLMRGIVMIIMTIDHVRDCFNPFAEPTDLSKASAGLVWALMILLLYPLCRWYAGYKARHKQQWWLSYL